MSEQDTKKILTSAIYRVCRSLVRILLRNGIPFAGFTDIAKKAYVDVAREEFGVEGKKVSDSRIATITGLTRKDVRRVKLLDIRSDTELAEHYNRAARVIFGWIHDKDYQDENAKPVRLKFEGNSPSFSALTKKYSGDVPPRAILDELEQVGVVKVLADDSIEILKLGYIPSTSQAEKLKLFGRDTSGLIDTVDRNIYSGEQAFFQRKVSYDELPEDAREEIRAMLEVKGQELLIYFDAIMAGRDASLNPDQKGKNHKAAGIGIYYFEDDGPEEQDS
ncbi:MAG: DUF6502 family protein [Gammaproteobacteria bacterium]|nr:DUF6502 family protein [Gammaproteobacteria bacterium]